VTELHEPTSDGSNVDQLWGFWNPHIVWRPRANDPNEYDLDAFPGWSLVAPWSLSPAELSEDLVTSFRLPDGDYLVLCRELTLRYRGPDLPMDESLVHERTSREVRRRLRYVTRQFDISLRRLAYGQRQTNSGASTIFEQAIDGERTYWPDYYLPTAVRLDHLKQVASLPATFEPPIHVEIMLDGLQAHNEEDPRKAILFAAIAAEAMAFDVLEAAYDQGLSDNDPALRIITLPLAGGGLAHKDPVYEVLRDADAFKHLLHTRPLYLLQRSLLLEAPDCYRRALKLYATRNKLVHRGKVPAEESYFPVTREGAIQALETARDILLWFGDSGPYCVSQKHASIDGSVL
jgi:hypothetical protein